MLRNMNLRQRLVFLVIVSCVAMVVLGAAGVYGIVSVEQRLQVIDQGSTKPGEQRSDVAQREIRTLVQEAALVRNAILIGSTLTVFLVGFFGYRMVRSIAAAVDAVREAMVRCSEGELTARANYNGPELKRVITAFHLMAEKIQALVTEIAGSSTRVATAAEELSAVTAETNAEIKRQQTETEQAATAMHEMSATAHEIARNAAGAANAAREADQAATHGSEVVTKTIETIRRLAVEMENTGAAVHRLDAESAGIGAVLDVIKNIAEQTNLLALNAAIEAARAGEQGRGFAVVADEVRTLASRTQKSTLEIQEMITRLQTGAQGAVQAMAQGSTQIQHGVSQAAEAGTALVAITGAVAKISEMNMQIASAAEEQSSVVEEVNRNIVAISQISGHVASGSQQTAAASDEMARLAAQLHTLVGRFKV